MRGVLIVAGLCVALCGPLQAKESVDDESGGACSQLASTDFSSLQDAPTQVVAAAAVPVAARLPAFCKIDGYVSPQVGFELRLPFGWNGKFIELGCGGTCGTLPVDECNGPLRKGYACIVTDMGHKGTGADDLWAANNLQAKIDFGYRASHVVALAGKAISQRYYNTAPKKSYFLGCSTGGRQAMMEVQRFPWHFDGVVAGAPAVNWMYHNLNGLWAPNVALGSERSPLLTASVARIVHEAALAKCDLDDGVKDGVVSNPTACKLDVPSLICKSSAQQNCLTPPQAAMVQKIYYGPRTASGERLYTGPAVGSEGSWFDVLIGSSGGSWVRQSSLERFRWLLFMPDLGSSWRPDDIDVDRDYKRMGLMEPLYAPNNPDLRRFRAAGGKLIIYQGWTDNLVMPDGILDYYEAVERTVGDRVEIQDFLRMFLLPGMDHCGGGAGANDVDYLDYLEGWVERGQAPDKLIAAHYDIEEFMKIHDANSGDIESEFDTFRSDRRNVKFTRPVYPYPTRARYLGRGDANDADNFGPIKE